MQIFEGKERKNYHLLQHFAMKVSYHYSDPILSEGLLVIMAALALHLVMNSTKLFFSCWQVASKSQVVTLICVL